MKVVSWHGKANMRHLDKMKNVKCPLCVLALFCPSALHPWFIHSSAEITLLLLPMAIAATQSANFYDHSLVTSSVNFIAFNSQPRSIQSWRRLGVRLPAAAPSCVVAVGEKQKKKKGMACPASNGVAGAIYFRKCEIVHLGHRNVARVEEWNSFILHCWLRSLKNYVIAWLFRLFAF